MITRLLTAGCLMALCVIIHAGGVTWALQRLRGYLEPSPKFWRETWLFIMVAIWMVLLHLMEISVWAAFYSWQGALPDLQSATYFSAVTYTTTGYGDLILPEEWRLVGGVEALTGILMCGWSTGFFIAIVSRAYAPRARARDS
jgi:NADH:ubiquinone oxidoreductase subunit 6 (subunit J)